MRTYHQVMEIKEIIGRITDVFRTTEFDDYDRYQRRKQQFDDAIAHGGQNPKDVLTEIANQNHDSKPQNNAGVTEHHS